VAVAINTMGKKEVITVQHSQTIESLHKTPPGGIRLSRLEPKFLISSGWDQDVTLSLWDLSTKQKVAENSTSQLLHKPILARASDHDIYAVAAHTNEIKLFKVGMKDFGHASNAF